MKPNDPLTKYETLSTIVAILIIAGMAFFMLVDKSEAHVITKRQCIHKAQTHGGNHQYRRYRRCWGRAKAHNDTHPTRGLPWIVQAIRACESGRLSNGRPIIGTYNYHADNASPTSDASGAYQYLDSSWTGRVGARTYEYSLGYSRALYAPPGVQDRRAIRDITRSTSPWNASRGCWGKG